MHSAILPVYLVAVDVQKEVFGKQSRIHAGLKLCINVTVLSCYFIQKSTRSYHLTLSLPFRSLSIPFCCSLAISK